MQTMREGVEVMRFKVGDKVRIKKDLDINRNYGDIGIMREMEEFLGNEARIIHVEHGDDKYYELDIDDSRWMWNDEMLEPIHKTDAEIMQELIEGRSDKVNSPSHYTRGDIEVIDIIKQLTQGYEPFEAYLVGNTIKYLARANFKENKQQDLEKAEWHINKLLEEEE